jgi:hypothetical protein
MSQAYRVVVWRRGHEAESHRIWICFEDIWLALRDKDLGHLALDEVDNSLDKITITRIKAKKLSRSKTLVREVLKRHNFDEGCYELVDEVAEE